MPMFGKITLACSLSVAVVQYLMIICQERVDARCEGIRDLATVGGPAGGADYIRPTSTRPVRMELITRIVQGWPTFRDLSKYFNQKSLLEP